METANQSAPRREVTILWEKGEDHPNVFIEGKWSLSDAPYLAELLATAVTDLVENYYLADNVTCTHEEDLTDDERRSSAELEELQRRLDASGNGRRP